MDFSFIKEKETTTVKVLMDRISIHDKRPETIIIVDNEDGILGTIPLRNFIARNPDTQIRILYLKEVTYMQILHFHKFLKFFAEYNLRHLPVVDEAKKI